MNIAKTGYREICKRAKAFGGVYRLGDIYGGTNKENVQRVAMEYISEYTPEQLKALGNIDKGYFYMNQTAYSAGIYGCSGQVYDIFFNTEAGLSVFIGKGYTC